MIKKAETRRRTHVCTRVFAGIDRYITNTPYATLCPFSQFPLTPFEVSIEIDTVHGARLKGVGIAQIEHEQKAVFALHPRLRQALELLLARGVQDLQLHHSIIDYSLVPERVLNIVE